MDFIILALATWRISSLLVDENGPFDVFNILRWRIGVKHNEAGVAYGDNVIGDMLSCVWCTSVWIGLVFCIGYYFYPLWAYWLAMPFAVSAGAVMVNRWVNG